MHFLCPLSLPIDTAPGQNGICYTQVVLVFMRFLDVRASGVIVEAGVNTRVTEIIAGSADTPVMETAVDIVFEVIGMAHMAHRTGGKAIRVIVAHLGIAIINRLGTVIEDGVGIGTEALIEIRIVAVLAIGTVAIVAIGTVVIAGTGIVVAAGTVTVVAAVTLTVVTAGTKTVTVIMVGTLIVMVMMIGVGAVVRVMCSQFSLLCVSKLSGWGLPGPV